MQHMSWNMRLAIYTVSIFFTSSSYTICVPFLPLYLLELGVPDEDIEFWSALVFSSCFLIAGIMAPIWGKLSDIVGKRNMALRASIMLCLAYSTGAFAAAPIHLLITRILQGFANGYLAVILSMISSQSPRERLGTSLSILQSAQLVGMVSGPLMGGALAQIFGYRASFVIASCFLALVVVITWLTPDGSSSEEISHKKTSIFADIGFCCTHRNILEPLIFYFIFNMVIFTYQPVIPLYVADIIGGFENVALLSGLACSLPTFIGSFISPLWGYFGQRRGYYLVMALAFLGAGLFLVLQGFMSNYVLFALMASLMGIFMVGVPPSVNASMTLETPADFKGRAFGMLTLSSQFGSFFGPIISALIAMQFALGIQFVLSGVIFILSSFYVIVRIIQRRREKQQLLG